MNTTLCERKRGTEKKLEKENEMDKKKKRRLGHGVVDEIFAVGWCKMHVPKLIRHFILQTQRWATDTLLMREAKTQAKTRVMRSLIFFIYINFLEFTGYSLQITNAYKNMEESSPYILSNKKFWTSYRTSWNICQFRNKIKWN